MHAVADVAARLRRLAPAAVVVSVLALADAGSHAQPPEPQPVFRSGTAAVIVDVVVRGRQGEAVAGLTEADFEVFEDGVPQRIISLDALGAAEGGGAGATPAGASTPVEPRVEGADASQAIVALIFHQLAHEGRAGVIEAARTMVASLAPHEYAGVFEVNLTLRIAAPFTRDRGALDAALDAVLASPPVQRGPGAMTLGVAERDGGLSGNRTPDGAIADDMRRRMAGDPEAMHRAAVQSTALSDVVSFLGRFPGRKSIVLFSDGLDVSPRLESVVAKALMEHVTVYSMHAGGLDAARRFAARHRAIDRRDLTSSSRRGRERWRYEMLEMDPTRGLAPLAEATGGFLVSDTNDFRAALASIAADRHAYYVLAYSSSNPALDGTTRRIEVRVVRKGLSVRARTAYVAAP